MPQKSVVVRASSSDQSAPPQACRRAGAGKPPTGRLLRTFREGSTPRASAGRRPARAARAVCCLRRTQERTGLRARRSADCRFGLTAANLGSSWVISSHLGPSRVISDHLGPSRVISVSSRAISDHLGPSRSISGHLGPSRAISAQPVAEGVRRADECASGGLEA